MVASPRKSNPLQPNIPVEIIRLILLKLQVKSLIQFQCVCKEWRSLIQDSDFKLSYCGQRRVIVVSDNSGLRSLNAISITNNFSLEREFPFRWHLPFLKSEKNERFGDRWPSYYVWCSCNGLVLFNVHQHLLLWNPSIRCCTKVLEHRHLSDFIYAVLSGLCYDSSTADYKVVLLLAYYTMVESRYVLVASLKDKKWRQVSFPYNLNLVRSCIDFQGTLHWVTSDIKRERNQPNYGRNPYDVDDEWVQNPYDVDDEWDNFSGCNKIVYFDPECDEFRDLPTPEPTHLGEEDSIVGLGILDGCLCMARKMKETGMIEVLVMEKYKIKESWVSKLFIPISVEVGDDYYHDMVLYFLEKNSRVLIWSRMGKKISVYDLKKNKLNNFLEESIYGAHIGICFYVESFDLPHEFIWRDDEHKLFADEMEWTRK